MGRFTGRVCVVTGGSSGIGLATAEQLAREGGKVVLAARGKERLEKAVDGIKASGGEAFGVVADASKEDDNKRLVDAVLDKYHRLDVSFINAGIHRAAKAVDVTDEMLDELLAANVKSVALGLKYQLPAIAKSGGGGAIVINSSIAGSNVKTRKEFVGNGPYAATKAAADMLMRHAAVEASKQGTQINSIAPGVVKTNLLDLPDDAYEEFGKGANVMHRTGRPEEIAHFLLSDDASFVMGTVLTADGGHALKA
ncbi:short-chain dehydrogenase/reductase SDR [Tribonema minus]|uniref:Short-chain dehydrogenase/reductase SDR n=1 Tax=Tribonema minus TaxID=303371 RepID=A0A836CAF4_9STRA|nr:short-chain dehydrogenase/reductase SDR [Tribonema minus]